MRAQENFPSRVVQASADRINQGGTACFSVSAVTFVPVSQELAWRVLTDYGRLTEFVPDLVVSNVLSRSTEAALVEQHSKAGFIFVSQVVRILVRIEERAMSDIDVTLVSGDMQHYHAHWQLEPFFHDGVDGTRLAFSAELEPQFYIPPMIGKPIVQANVKQMVEAVASEIERRGAH